MFIGFTAIIEISRFHIKQLRAYIGKPVTSVQCVIPNRKSGFTFILQTFAINTNIICNKWDRTELSKAKEIIIARIKYNLVGNPQKQFYKLLKANFS